MGYQRILDLHRSFNCNCRSLVFLDLRLGLVYFWCLFFLLCFDWDEHYSRLSQTFLSQSISRQNLSVKLYVLLFGAAAFEIQPYGGVRSIANITNMWILMTTPTTSQKDSFGPTWGG